MAASDVSDAANSKNVAQRIAKVIARSGYCSRRAAEALIAQRRVALNGSVIETPATRVGPRDTIAIDNIPLPARARTRLWLYHKPAGVLTAAHDPRGRRTIYDTLPSGLPRVMPVGRLDMTTQGLLLLTNDGGLKRVLELPKTGWLRKYRVRAFGKTDQTSLDKLRAGITVEGVNYGAIVATLERTQGANQWLEVALREGKNREVKIVLATLGLTVNRLIRISFGPFQLGSLAPAGVREVKSKVLKSQLGERLSSEAGADFDAVSPPPPIITKSRPAAKKRDRYARHRRTS